MDQADVIVIGAGGGGAVIAKELGENGLQVLVVEAGAWFGNKKWPDPNGQPGAKVSTSEHDLDIALYKRLLNEYENNMNDWSSGRFRWGPAERTRPPWSRNTLQKGFIWQNSGVGGTTQHYLANSPRAYPLAIDGQWPLSYRELLPYYEQVESTLPVHFAPITAKEELFFYGAKKAGFEPLPTLDVHTPGYRPQPNAILPPNKALNRADISLEQLSWMEGCTLAGHCINGCPHGPSVPKIAKRSADVSYIPLALQTGNVRIRPNSVVVRIHTEPHALFGVRASGVRLRDTWTGEQEEIAAKVVVMAAGCIESPRLWLLSGLPKNPWVGRGLVNHCMDLVTGIFTAEGLRSALGSPETYPFVGPTSGARLDYPGLGAMQVIGMSPGLTATLSYGTSEAGYHFLHPTKQGEPWDIQGMVVGPELEAYMGEYRRSLHILISTADEVDRRNGVVLDPLARDEHGRIPVVRYHPTLETRIKRNKLAAIAAQILRQAGARTVIRADWPPGIMIHLESTMRMGHVVDENCEAFQVKRLFLADNSVHVNSLGGPNPTLTTQALATRTAEKVIQKYFS